MQRRAVGDEEAPRSVEELVFHKNRFVPAKLLIPIAIIALLIVAASVFTSDEIENSVRVAFGQMFGPSKVQPQDKPTTAGEPILLPFEKKVAKAEALQVAAAKAKAADDHTTKAGRTLITTVRDSKGTSVDIYDEPIPKDCYAEDHGDYDGNGIQWGLTNKGISAADCCRQCKEFRAPNLPAGVQGYCNVWTWCGHPSGVCWTMDIHTHKTGDCWLKYQEKWDNNTDLTKTNLIVNHRGKYSDEFRKHHKTAPEHIQWISGLVVP